MVAALHLLGALTTLCVAAFAMPSHKRVNDTTSAMRYLAKFGYMDPKILNPQVGMHISDDVLRNTIMEFQEFSGLEQTGELDEDTLNLMNKPRCGVKDKVGSLRGNKYTLEGSKWNKKHLTYRITKYSRKLSRNVVNIVIARAFKVWQDVADLTFQRSVRGPVDIEIRFEEYDHGDDIPFDGYGGDLGHAFFPYYGGATHFDDSEVWTIKSYQGTNLLQVAVHEFGHALGLKHSNVRNATMFSTYDKYNPNFKLHWDDIAGIQALYGNKKVYHSPPPEEDMCRDGSFDAITTLANKKTYVFKGTQYWEMTDEGASPGYPRSIYNDFGLPSGIDAAFTRLNGKTYFFKGNKFWRFTGLTPDARYPKNISQAFAGIPDNIDAAFVLPETDRIYFFKGSQYWEYKPCQIPPIHDRYPQPISVWNGLPNNIDGALPLSDGYIYFFKDGQYWRFDHIVNDVFNYYPESTDYWFFGCSA